MSTNGGSDFLGRWSRLKRERAAPGPAEEADVAPAPPPPVEEVAAPMEPVTGEATSDEEILRELGLPEPESLKPGDDFSAFLAKAVPEHLRRRALRRLWSSNPVLACLDGLVDYADDYTDAALATGTLKTAYTVGRGFRSDLAQDPAPGAADRGDDAAPMPETGEGPHEIASAADDPEERPDEAGEVETAGREPVGMAPETPVVAHDPEPPGRRRPARMRFHQADS